MSSREILKLAMRSVQAFNRDRSPGVKHYEKFTATEGNRRP
jgi:hypothetical protein